MTSNVSLRKEATSQNLVDPYGSNLTMCLEALTRVNVAARNRVITTRAGEFRAGPVAEIAEWINPMEPLPIDAAGLIAIDIQYVRRNFRTRSTLERRGIPSTSIIRLPVNDEGVARRINGTEADFSSVC